MAGVYSVRRHHRECNGCLVPRVLKVETNQTPKPARMAAADGPVACVSFEVAYTQAAVTRALSSAGWNVASAAADAATPNLWWADFSAIPWDDVLSGAVCASTQYFKAGLVRKADLLHYMSKHGCASWHPHTVVGDIEDDEDIADMVERWAACRQEDGKPRPLWLLKPSRGNRGEGIAVLVQDDEPALRAALAACPQHREWLLQRYVEPLLLPADATAQPVELPSEAPPAAPRAGLKCHLRVHVLAIGAMSVWVHDAPLVLLASEPWIAPERSLVASGSMRDQPDVSDSAGDEGGEVNSMRAHLTNHAQQMGGACYDECSHTRRLSEAFSPALAASLLSQAKAIAADAFKPFAKGSAAFFPLPHCCMCLDTLRLPPMMPPLALTLMSPYCLHSHHRR